MSTDPSTLDIRYVASLARLDLTDEEAATYEAQLQDILQYMKKLDEVDVSGIEPTAHANPILNITRPDLAIPSLSTEEAMANAPKTNADQFIVPKVVE